MTYNTSNGQWESVGSPGFLDAKEQSLVISPTGALFVAFQNSFNFKTRVMTYNTISGQWENVGSPDFSAAFANFQSLAIGSSGALYVAFSAGSNGSGGTTVMTYNTISGQW